MCKNSKSKLKACWWDSLSCSSLQIVCFRASGDGAGGCFISVWSGSTVTRSVFLSINTETSKSSFHQIKDFIYSNGAAKGQSWWWITSDSVKLEPHFDTHIIVLLKLRCRAPARLRRRVNVHLLKRWDAQIFLPTGAVNLRFILGEKVQSFSFLFASSAEFLPPARTVKDLNVCVDDGCIRG